MFSKIVLKNLNTYASREDLATGRLGGSIRVSVFKSLIFSCAKKD